MNKTLKECYEVLGVGLEATSEEIKRAYKNQALACHPDKNRDDPDAVQKFQELGYAYKKITSDDKDEEEDDWEDMFSDFDYWLEFFIYCMYEEGLMFDDIGCQHCCNCAHCDSDDDDSDEDDDDDDEDCCRKHRQKRKEENFTKEEMERFVKFNSLEEQREFNKKIFCNSKQTTKEKKKQQIQKPKGKSNKQLKAEEWKRQKEISKIAEEIEIKRKQQEEKLEQSRELSSKKKTKVVNSLSSIMQDAIKVPNNKQSSSNVHKVKSKKKKKRGRAKNDSNESKVTEDNTKKIYQKPQIPQVPAIKKGTETKINHTKKTNIPLPAMKPKHTKTTSSQSRTVAKPVPTPSPAIPAPQPPNIWQKRMETQNEIQQILPSNEEEELRQLQMALEMSRNLAEMEEQQKQIAALQEELELISLEQENLKLCLSDSDEESQGKAPLDARAGISLTGKTHTGDKDNNQAYSKVEVENDTSSLQKNLNNEGIVFRSSSHDQEKDVQHLKYEPCKPKTCTSQWEEKNVCPYGRNCCLGKRCKKFHPSSKRSERLEVNRDPCIVRMKSATTCSDLESKLLNGSDTKDCEQKDDNTIAASTVTLSEDWDDSSDPSTASTMPCVVQNHPSEEDWGHEEEWISVYSQDSDHTSSDSEDKAPLSSITFQMTEKSQENENCDSVLKECEVVYGNLPQGNTIHMEILSQHGLGIQSDNTERVFHSDNQYHRISSNKSLKTDADTGRVPEEVVVANGNLPGPPNVSQGVCEMSPRMPQNYMPSYPFKGNLPTVHPAANNSLNGVQPLLPVLGFDMLSGLTNACQFNQNVIMNSVNNSISNTAPFPLGQMATGSFTSQNHVLSRSPTSQLSTVPVQGLFHAGNMTSVSPGIPVSSQVQMQARVQSTASNHDASVTSQPLYESPSGTANQTSTNTNMVTPSSYGETANDKQTSQQVKTVTPGSITNHGNSQVDGCQHWSNVGPPYSQSTAATHPVLPIPGLSMPTLQNMNPLLPIYPGLPLPQQGVMSNPPKMNTWNAPGIQNPPFGFQCGVPLANGTNLMSLMALEAQYLNMVQSQMSSSLLANQQTNPSEPIINGHSTQGEQSTNIPDVERQKANNKGSNIRKPVTVPRVLSYVESR